MIGMAKGFLERQPPTTIPNNGKDPSSGTRRLPIGTFCHTSVNLVWDDEFSDRCFLVVGVSGKPCLHLTLANEEIRHLTEALRQVESDLGVLESAEAKAPSQSRL